MRTMVFHVRSPCRRDGALGVLSFFREYWIFSRVTAALTLLPVLCFLRHLYVVQGPRHSSDSTRSPRGAGDGPRRFPRPRRMSALVERHVFHAVVLPTP
jgi:hypothetical protein